MYTSESKSHEPIRKFTKVPNALVDLYTRLPNFKADHVTLYSVLSKYHNAEYGYAFPDTWDLAIALNCGESKVADLKKVLVYYDLIETRRHPEYGNDVYFLFPPIDTEEEFYAKYPEAKEYYESQLAKFNKRRESGLKRKKAFDERVKAQKQSAITDDTTPEDDI